MTHYNGISIIVCVHNGAKKITSTLQALAAQNIPYGMQCELLIIDNASSDNTAEIANQFWESVNAPFPIITINEPKAGKANALIKGYNNARYELMLLCDDDNWLQPNYLITACEIYSLHPQIGLLGGYGKAFFEKNTKPKWFNKWENCYVCGKHHEKNGFLKPSDFSIWGAGSVLRKSMWVFLRNSGFTFYNSTTKGKAMSEDAELSMAISFTQHRLYFDERLWFYHDLRDGRITWDNLITQQSLNGKTNAILYIYSLVIEHVNETTIYVKWFVIKKILGLLLKTGISFLKPNNKPRWIYFYNIFYELLTNINHYTKLGKESIKWIKQVNNAKPLSENDNITCFGNANKELTK